MCFLQVYKGLDVITAKATEEERNRVPHHLLDVVDPLKAFTVVDFRNAALKIVSFYILKLLTSAVNSITSISISEC